MSPAQISLAFNGLADEVYSYTEMTAGAWQETLSAGGVAAFLLNL